MYVRVFAAPMSEVGVWIQSLRGRHSLLDYIFSEAVIVPGSTFWPLVVNTALSQPLALESLLSAYAQPCMTCAGSGLRVSITGPETAGLLGAAPHGVDTFTEYTALDFL